MADQGCGSGERCALGRSGASSSVAEPSIPAAAVISAIPRGSCCSAAEVRVGQVWEVGPATTAEDDRVLVVIAHDDEVFFACPATFDLARDTDGWTAQLAWTGGDGALAVWVALEQVIEPALLVTLRGSVDAKALGRLHTALRRGHRPPLEFELGRPLDPALVRYREELRSAASGEGWSSTVRPSTLPA